MGQATTMPPNHERRRLPLVHAAVGENYWPGFECRSGCVDCCEGGAIPVGEAEFAQVYAYAHEHGIKPHFDETKPRACPWLTPAEERHPDRPNCRVWPARPTICEAFGHHADMACPHGAGPADIPTGPRNRALRALDVPARVLHEVLPPRAVALAWLDTVLEPGRRAARQALERARLEREAAEKERGA
jgi:Fe-S-cluster containining protein